MAHSSDTIPTSDPPAGRRLRRAVNLLQSNGQPTSPELATIQEGQTARPTLKRGGIGGSIRRIFKGVIEDAKVIRSRSFSRKRRSTGQDLPAKQTKRAHVRSFSDVLSSRPTVTRGPQDIIPPPLITARSAPVLDSDLSGVEVSSPIGPDIHVPQTIEQGTVFTRVTRKKRKSTLFHLDAEQGQISWDSKIVPIECIKEIRSGSDGQYYRQQFQLSDEYEARWITIVYILDGNYKTLHLIAKTQPEFDAWDTSLRKLHAIRQELMSGSATLEMKQAIWEKQYWKVADEQADQKLDFDEVEKLCKRLNVNTPTDELYRLFKQADRTQRGYLDFHDFRRFVKLLKGRPEVAQLYHKLRGENNGVFDITVFTKFMREEQQCTLPDQELEKIFTRYTQVPDGSASPPPRVLELPLSSSPPQLTIPPPLARTSTSHSSLAPGSLSLDGFTSFLLSSDNSAFADQHTDVWQDMTRPLPEYYISSSHNTYLVGHQLVGDSTIEGYIRALLHSCRSVEVDIYDGEDEPMIFHGKTLTSKVSLREVCEAIAKYGFITSPYPIIISAEIHCGLAQQDMMVEIMRSVFGETLVTAPLDDSNAIETLPSPEDLKGRILLKAKNLLIEKEKEPVEAESSIDISSSSTSDSEFFPDFILKARRRSSNADGRSSGFLSRKRSHKRSASASVAPSTTPNAVPPSPLLSPTGVVRTISRRSQTSDKPKPKMSFALVALLVYTVGVKCRGINKKENYKPEHMFSLSENTANKYLKQAVMDLIKHNKSHLVRIYPKGTRLNSTNYEPHRFWAAGAQLVAINWQTFDLGYMINHAMFQRNGRAGYVLKPDALRTSDKTLLQQRTRHRFDVTVISAQQLPRPKDPSGREIVHKSIIDPYVEVSLHVPEWASSVHLAPGVPHSSSPPMVTQVHCYRTGAVKNNGFNPVWHETLSFQFECVGGMLDLVFVKFAVRWEDKDNAEPLAFYCTSLGSLQRGYRHLPLHDAQLSQYLFSTLFVHSNIQSTP